MICLHFFIFCFLGLLWQSMTNWGSFHGNKVLSRTQSFEVKVMPSNCLTGCRETHVPSGPPCDWLATFDVPRLGESLILIPLWPSHSLPLWVNAPKRTTGHTLRQHEIFRTNNTLPVWCKVTFWTVGWTQIWLGHNATSISATVL